MLLEERINKIKNSNNNSCDFNSRIINVKNKKIGYIFLESVSSDDKISDYLVKSLNKDLKKSLFNDLFHELENSICNSKIKSITEDEIFYYLTSGFTCILIENEDKIIAVETKSKLDRGVSETSIESIVRGPKDSFTENHMINIGLIRKRIKDINLVFEEIKIGKRTQTKVSVAYINDIVKKEKIDKINEKLKKIDIDGILDSGVLKTYLCGKNKSNFPKIISTERPDNCCQHLLDGRIVILVENSPIALIIPGIMIDIFHIPEDYYQQPFNVTITRALRLLGFLITILTPALYIALTTFNFEIVPNNLLISIAVQRQGVPFPTGIEVLLLLTTFEILRESDARLPNQMGAAVSIVGALVLGEAAVSAGIVSPIVLIIVAATSVSGLLYTDIDVVNAIRLWRIIFILAATFMGLIGIVVMGIIFITKLSSIECLGTPYTSSFSPFNLDSQKDAIIKFPQNKIKKRPFFLKDKDNTKTGDIK